MTILLILLNFSFVIALYVIEKQAFKSWFMGPCTIFLALLTLTFTLQFTPLVTFEFSIYPEANMYYTFGNFIFLIGASLCYMVPTNIRRDSMRQPPTKIFITLFKILLLCAFVGYLLNLHRLIEFGVINALKNPGHFHQTNQQASMGGGAVVRLMRTIFVSPQILVTILIFFIWRYLPKSLKFVCAFYLFCYVVQLVVYGGRGAFVTGIATFVWSLFLMQNRLPKISRKMVIFTLIIGIGLGLISIRRTSYLGENAAHIMKKRFAITETAIPDHLLTTPLGSLFIQTWAYFGGTYTNYSAIYGDFDLFQLSYGTRSIRLLNPAVRLVSPSFANKQKINFESNMLMLRRHFHSASNQWPTVYGYFLMDFGKVGTLFCILINGFFLAFATRMSFRFNTYFKFLSLLICYSCSFASFVMPFTAMYGGFLRIGLFLVSLYLYYIGRNRQTQ